MPHPRRHAPRGRGPRPSHAAFGLLASVATASGLGGQVPDPPAESHHAAHGKQEARGARLSGGIGAQAIGVVTRVDPAFVGRVFTEGYLTQPVIMAHARYGGTAAGAGVRVTVDLEGATLRRGELTPGIYGEGYVDRRHPHTWGHELVALVDGAAGPLQASLAGGKGFVPFGTDDPMMRPFVKYPVNHHLAQVLERAVAIGALRAGPLVVEAARFNGDEPDSPDAWPTRARFWDSWSVRATAWPLPGLELQGSRAWVHSPEEITGEGSDQRKWSTSARWSGGAAPSEPGAGRYALVEWALTDDVVAGVRSFRFTSLLAEGSVTARRGRAALRLERTIRPEEERLLDPFRTPQPHTDLSLLGRTRWDVATVHLATRPWRPVRGRWAGGLALMPFLEASRAQATPIARPTLFEPREFYGSAGQWHLSMGVRVDAGMRHARMGRYGVAEPAGGSSHRGHHPDATR